MRRKNRILKYIILTLSCVVLFLLIGLNYKELKGYLVNQEPIATETVSKDPSVIPKPTIESEVIDEIIEPEITQTPEVTKQPDETKQPEEPQVNQKVTLSFVGDILLSDGILANYDKKGMDGILSKEIQTALNDATLTIANEEFPFSERGEQAKDKQYTFRIAPERVNIFNQMGIDIVTIANNHTLDFGKEALLDTLDTLDAANITYIGAGNNLNRAKEIQYKTVDGLKIAFLGASRVIPVPEWNATDKKPGMLTTYDPTILLEQIKKAKEQAEFTVVYLHWGIERKTKPEDYQRYLAKQYIDAGADLVVGSHPHCLQGIEYYNGKPIIYSLGNFLFGTNIDKTAVLQATIEASGESTISILPCKGTNFYTQTISDSNQKAQFYKYLEEISYGITIDENGTVHP